MEFVHVCLPANHEFMLCKFSLPVSSYPHKVPRRNSIVISFFVTECTPEWSFARTPCWLFRTIFLSFVFHSRTIPHLLQCFSDYFNHLIYRRMHLFLKNFITYELQNMLVGTYPVAEHYRDCRKDLDCDS